MRCSARERANLSTVKLADTLSRPSCPHCNNQVTGPVGTTPACVTGVETTLWLRRSVVSVDRGAGRLVLEPESQGRGRIFEINYSNAAISTPARETLQTGLVSKDLADPTVPDRTIARC